MDERVQTGMSPRPRRRERPEWLKVRFRPSARIDALHALVEEHGLHTVCKSASCPNLPECWGQGTATFMLGGDCCTRRCGFCDVSTGRPAPLDPDEPQRVAAAIRLLGVRFAVITAVARDDLSDGGAAHFASTVRAVRGQGLSCRVEVLIPDFKGSERALETVLAADPDVLNHNIETVERLQPRVRPQADYRRSLAVLAQAWRLRPEIPTKTGIMLGLGETESEIRQTLADLHDRGCRLLTVGQYLRPSAEHLPVERYVTPQEFAVWKQEALRIGFRKVASDPLVRSSYHAEMLADPQP